MGTGFLCREIEGQIEILRCYHAAGFIEIPESIGGKRVVSLGDYIFSADMKKEPKGFFWQEEGGEGVPEMLLYCGGAVEEIFLPPSIKKMGRYAFYNCDRLKRLHFTDTILDIGAGAFNGCRKITDLYVGIGKGEKSCLKEVLAELTEMLTVHYRIVGGKEEAKLLFPVLYEEAVENTPARMLETHTHGCGHRYRYCFKGSAFQFKEYDALFPHAVVQESPDHLVQLCANRLRYPMELSKAAEYGYRKYILEHIDAMAVYLVNIGDITEWRWFLDSFTPRNAGSKTHKRIEFEHAFANCLGNEGLAVRAHEEFNNIWELVLGETSFDKLIEVSNRFGCIDALSLIMDAKYQSFPLKNKKFEL